MLASKLKQDLLVAPRPFQKENTPSSPSSKSGRYSKNALRSAISDRSNSLLTFVTLSKRVYENGAETTGFGGSFKYLANFFVVQPVLPSSLEHADAGKVVNAQPAHVSQYLRMRFDNRMMLRQRVFWGLWCAEEAINLEQINLCAAREAMPTHDAQAEANVHN